MNFVIIFLAGYLVLGTNGGTYTVTYVRGNPTNFISSAEPKGQTIWKFNFDNVFWLDTRTLGSSLVQFEVTAQNRGFVGFGFRQNYRNDIVIAGVDDSTNRTYNFDMHSPENSNDLIRDTKQESDWELKSSSQDLSKNTTKLSFQRLLKTTDTNLNQDLELKVEDVNIMWYLGASDDVQGEIVITRQGSSLPCNLLVDGAGVGTNKALPTASASIFIFIITFSLLFFYLDVISTSIIL